MSILTCNSLSLFLSSSLFLPPPLSLFFFFCLFVPPVLFSNTHQRFEKISAWKKRYPFSYEKAVGENMLKPQQILEEVNRQTEHLNNKLIYTTGVGCHQMWAAQYIRWRHPRSFVTSGGSGTMGFGLPAAIGAQLGRPDAMVIDIDGDASFAMTCQE